MAARHNENFRRHGEILRTAGGAGRKMAKEGKSLEQIKKEVRMPSMTLVDKERFRPTRGSVQSGDRQ